MPSVFLTQTSVRLVVAEDKTILNKQTGCLEELQPATQRDRRQLQQPAACHQVAQALQYQYDVVVERNAVSSLHMVQHNCVLMCVCINLLLSSAMYFYYADKSFLNKRQKEVTQCLRSILYGMHYLGYT